MLVKAKITALPYQADFAVSGIETDDRYTLLLGGYGSGKSKAIPMRVISIMKWRTGRGERADILVIAPTYDLLQGITVPDMEEFLDRYCIPYRYHKQKRIMQIMGPGFSGIVRFKTAQNPERIVGFNCSDFIIEEYDIIRYADQEIVWNKALARIRLYHDATGAVVTTPEGFKYTYELFEDGIGEGDKKKIVGRTIRARTYDNIFLPDDYVDSLYGMYDPQLVKQYIEAQYVNINGRAAYYSFDRTSTSQVIPFEPMQPSAFALSVDFNVDPMTATAWIRNGTTSIAFDEFFLRNSNTERLVEVVKDKYPGSEITAYPDMTGIRRQTSYGVSISDIKLLKNAGFRIRGSRNPKVRDRLASVNNALSKGWVQVMDNCHHLIKDFEQVIIDDHGELDKGGNKLLTHPSDNAGYYISKEYPIRQPRSRQK